MIENVLLISMLVTFTALMIVAVVLNVVATDVFDAEPQIVRQPFTAADRPESDFFEEEVLMKTETFGVYGEPEYFTVDLEVFDELLEDQSIILEFSFNDEIAIGCRTLSILEANGTIFWNGQAVGIEKSDILIVIANQTLGGYISFNEVHYRISDASPEDSVFAVRPVDQSVVDDIIASIDPDSLDDPLEEPENVTADENQVRLASPYSTPEFEFNYQAYFPSQNHLILGIDCPCSHLGINGDPCKGVSGITWQMQQLFLNAQMDVNLHAYGWCSSMVPSPTISGHLSQAYTWYSNWGQNRLSTYKIEVLHAISFYFGLAQDRYLVDNHGYHYQYSSVLGAKFSTSFCDASGELGRYSGVHHILHSLKLNDNAYGIERTGKGWLALQATNLGGSYKDVFWNYDECYDDIMSLHHYGNCDCMYNYYFIRQPSYDRNGIQIQFVQPNEKLVRHKTFTTVGSGPNPGAFLMTQPHFQG